MRPTTTFAHLALCLGTMTSLAAAWPRWMEEMHLVVRQDGGDSGDNADAAPSDSTTENQPSPTGDQATRKLNTASTLNPDAPRPTKTTGGPKGNSTDKEEFDPRSPAGAVVMVTPNPFVGIPLYKAGDFVTWEWNYTNLLASPTAIDILLSCSRVTATYTLTANMTFEEVGHYTWDSRPQRDDASQPLLTEEYTLIIKDADADVTETAAPGYLKSSNERIEIYTPKAYTPLSDWNCATCSAAAGDLDQKALGFAVSMCLITIFSFTWFVTGLRL